MQVRQALELILSWYAETGVWRYFRVDVAFAKPDRVVLSSENFHSIDRTR